MPTSEAGLVCFLSQHAEKAPVRRFTWPPKRPLTQGAPRATHAPALAGQASASQTSFHPPQGGLRGPSTSWAAGSAASVTTPPGQGRALPGATANQGHQDQNPEPYGVSVPDAQQPFLTHEQQRSGQTQQWVEHGQEAGA